MKQILKNRRLIWKLAKNDFKKRYAGSYLGRVWALAQPVVTVIMYYIVFDKIFGTKAEMLSSGIEMPYVLFLTAGLVPWFYFSETMTNGMQALLEYSYLVKKVVFDIDILPLIKMIGASFIHVFFVCILVGMACCYGYFPTIYTIQLLYYSLCLFVLVLGISYATCALVVFFRDLAQIIAIGLQIGMWATPVLWDLGRIGLKAQFLIKINPLVYIVSGYRNALCERIWFFEDIYYTLYFWAVTLLLFWLGNRIFQKLKVHFSDVL